MLAVLGVAGCAAAPSASLAAGPETFCVHQSGYTCPAGSLDAGSDLQAALTKAEANPVATGSPNRVNIGPGTYSVQGTDGFNYRSGNPLTITGAGPGATTLTGTLESNPDQVLLLDGSGGAPGAVSVSGLSVAQDSPHTAGIVLVDAQAHHLAVTSGAADVIGAALTGSTLTSSSISETGSPSTGVKTQGPGNEVDDVTVNTVDTGVQTTGQTTLHRMNVTSQWGVRDEAAPVYIDDSLVRAPFAIYATEGSGQASVNALNDTLIDTSPAGYEAYGVWADAPTGIGSDIQVINSVVRGYPFAFATGGSNATIEGFSNNYDGILEGSDIGVQPSVGGDPQFVDPANGNYHLAAASPLIDASATANLGSLSSTIDLDGHPRVVTVTHATTPVDLGAYEYQPPALLHIVGQPSAQGSSILTTLSCTGAPCTGIRLTATAVRNGHTVVVGSRSPQLAAGKTRTFTLALNGTGRAMLAAAKSLSVTLTVTMGTGPNAVTVGTAQVTLTVP